MAKKTDDNQAVTTNRQKITERLRSRNPELNTEDDELLFGQISSDYDTFDQRDQERERFNEAIAKNPESAGILTGLYTGKNEDGSEFDLGMYLIDEYPEMVEDLIEGNPKVKERYIASRDNRKAAAEEEKTFAAQVAEKTATEDAELDAAIKEAGYRPEEVKDLIDWIYNPESGLINRASRFELTKDDFLKLFRIKDYDTNIAKADEAGYVRGKNEKIDITARQQEKRRELPVINGGGGKPESKDEDRRVQRLKQMGGAYTV